MGNTVAIGLRKLPKDARSDKGESGKGEMRSDKGGETRRLIATCNLTKKKKR